MSHIPPNTEPPRWDMLQHVVLRHIKESLVLLQVELSDIRPLEVPIYLHQVMLYFGDEALGSWNPQIKTIQQLPFSIYMRPCITKPALCACNSMHFSIWFLCKPTPYKLESHIDWKLNTTFLIPTVQAHNKNKEDRYITKLNKQKTQNVR